MSKALMKARFLPNRFFTRFLRCEGGATAIEYGLLMGLIAAALVPTLTAIGSFIGGVFLAISAALQP